MVDGAADVGAPGDEPFHVLGPQDLTEQLQDPVQGGLFGPFGGVGLLELADAPDERPGDEDRDPGGGAEHVVVVGADPEPLGPLILGGGAEVEDLVWVGGEDSGHGRSLHLVR